MKTESTSQTDRITGAALRSERHRLNLTQQKMAGAAGISFQQLQKYETGRNRLSISMLIEIARTTGIDATTVFATALTDNGGNHAS